MALRPCSPISSKRRLCANAPANFYGFTPFTGKPFTTPREDYFAHVDTIVKLAAEKGIAVFIFPLFLGYQCGSEDGGWCGEVQNATIPEMRTWARCRQPIPELR